MTPALRRTLVALTLVLGVATAANAVSDQGQKGKEKTPPSAVFEVYKDAGGDYRFRFKDADGAIVASAPKGYGSKADCMKAVDYIKQNAGKARVEEQADKGKGK